MGGSRQVPRIEAQPFANSDSAPRSENDYAPKMFNRTVRANTEGRQNERHYDLWICTALPETFLVCQGLAYVQSESLNQAANSGRSHPSLPLFFAFRTLPSSGEACGSVPSNGEKGASDR